MKKNFTYVRIYVVKFEFCLRTLRSAQLLPNLLKKLEAELRKIDM